MANKSNTALISIHPEHVSKILNGSKTFEFRKRISSRVSRIAIYATNPVQKIVAFADVEEIIQAPPQILWRNTRGGAGISYDFFQSYFCNSDVASALKIGNVQKLSSPISLKRKDLLLTPPQSYLFLDNKQVDVLDREEKESQPKRSLCFVGGIHGSGKSFISNKYISSFGYWSTSASSLIKKMQVNVPGDKRVENVTFNQNVLIEAFDNYSKGKSRIALDGHFCLINKNGDLEKVPKDIFQSLNPSILFLVYAPEDIIQMRLNKRKDKIRLNISLKDFQKEEKRYAIEIANMLEIPLVQIDSTKTAKVNFKVIKNAFDQILCDEQITFLEKEGS